MRVGNSVKSINPKVSIIMGIYNCEKTLRESIDSIINQGYDNWELIMCDDCSTDSTFCIAQRYKDMYPDKIKLINNEFNLTLAPTLNKCLKIASGEYIARQDGDDISVSNRLEVQVEFLERNLQFDLVASSMTSFDENGVKGVRGWNKQIPQKQDLIYSVPFCHATIMTRAKVYKDLSGYRVNKYTTRCEDVDLWFRFFDKGFRGYNLQEPLYMVRDDNEAYKRRTFRNYFNLFLVNLNGYKLLKVSKKYYLYLLKPLLSAITPNFIIKIYHKTQLT